VKNLLSITLGVMTALGGFVDVGQLVFTMQAGALFGYRLAWSVVLGTIGIIVFLEMSGRIAAVKQKAVFDVVRDRLGKKLGLATLVAANGVNVITCAAQLGAIGIILRLFTGMSYGWLTIAGTLALVATVAALRFKWIERLFGLTGLLLLVYLFAAFKARPDWHAAAAGFLPTLPAGGIKQHLLYAYFAIGIFSAVLMPYEVYFYSSGGIEEGWSAKDVPVNEFIATASSALGGVLTLSLIALATIFYLPKGIFPDLLSTTAMAASLPYGRTALLLAMIGILAAVAGAAVETALSTAYNICQFFEWKWGKSGSLAGKRRFTFLWLATFGASLLLILTHIDPLMLVEFSIVFALLPLPLTYRPLLLLAKDREAMGKHASSRFDTALGWFFFGLVCIAAVAAVPLMILTHMGKP